MRLAVGVLVLAVLVARLGTGPFVEGLRLTDAGALLAASAITAITTLCCAWRWRAVAERLGVTLDPWSAVAAVYRAQFLNATLPGGILGDVDRAVGSGRDTGALGLSVRAVVWERTLGQVVQLALTVAVLLVVPSPIRPIGVVVLAGVAVLGVVAALSVGFLRRSRSVSGRTARSLGTDLRSLLRPGAARTTAVLTSAVASAGHIVVFLVAADVAGVTAPTYQLLPLGALVLLAAAVPANVAGWGPREGVAAWAFGAAGLGVTTGVTTAVVYGVMALVATLPGAALLLAGRRRRVARLIAPALEEAARA